MATGFVIAEYKSIKKDFPEFKFAEESLYNRLIAKANADWAPETFGNMTPESGQYSMTTILPPLMAGVLGTPLVTWNQVFTSTGDTIILTGSHAGGIIPEDFKIGWTGLLFADKSIRVSELKWQIGQSKYGRVNIEEIQCYEKPALIFEGEGYILDEKQGFDLHAYVTCRGQQRIVPLGFQLNKIPNRTQITACGAVLE
jgi:hypothetical protein